jgi:hypothetical protein
VVGIITRRIILILLVLATAGAVGALTTVSATPTIIVAAADAPADIASIAHVRCDGHGDQAEINRAFASLPQEGGVVQLTPGNYHTDGTISPRGGTTLTGAGETATVISMEGDYGARIDIAQPYTTVQSLTITNRGWLMITTSHVRVHDVTIRDSKKTAPTVNGMFFVWADGRVCEDIEFVRCKAIDVGSTGFNLNGCRSPRVNRNIKFDSCLALRCGNEGSGKKWAVGFDFHEGADLYDLLVTNCRAEDCWETGFYFEPNFWNEVDPNTAIPVQVNSRMYDCVAINNGWRNTEPTRFYMSGFYLSSGVTLERCVAVGNKQNGFWVWQGAEDVILKDCTDQSSDVAFQIRTGTNIVVDNCYSRDARTYGLYTWGNDGHTINLHIIEPRRDAGYISIGTRLDHPNENWAARNTNFNITVAGAPVTAAFETAKGSNNRIVIREAGNTTPQMVPDNTTTIVQPPTMIPTRGGIVTATTTIPNPVITPSWESYSYTLNIATAGVYTIMLGVSSPVSGSTLKLSVDGGAPYAMNVPNTGSHGTSVTISANANLQAGHHLLEINADGDARVNSLKVVAAVVPTPTPTIWVTLTPTMVTPEPTPTPTATPSPTPTATPSPTPSPTPEPSPTPNATPIVIPTAFVTLTPTPTANVTQEPTPVANITPVANLTPTPTYPWILPNDTTPTPIPVIVPTTYPWNYETPGWNEPPTTAITTTPTTTSPTLNPYNPWVYPSQTWSTPTPKPSAITVINVSTNATATPNQTAIPVIVSNRTPTPVPVMPTQSVGSSGAMPDLTIVVGAIVAIFVIIGLGLAWRNKGIEEQMDAELADLDGVGDDYYEYDDDGPIDDEIDDLDAYLNGGAPTDQEKSDDVSGVDNDAGPDNQ